MLRYRSILVVLCAFALSSCSSDFSTIQGAWLHQNEKEIVQISNQGEVKQIDLNHEDAIGNLKFESERRFNVEKINPAYSVHSKERITQQLKGDVQNESDQSIKLGALQSVEIHSLSVNQIEIVWNFSSKSVTKLYRKLAEQTAAKAIKELRSGNEKLFRTGEILSDENPFKL